MRDEMRVKYQHLTQTVLNIRLGASPKLRSDQCLSDKSQKVRDQHQTHAIKKRSVALFMQKSITSPYPFVILENPQCFSLRSCILIEVISISKSKGIQS